MMTPRMSVPACAIALMLAAAITPADATQVIVAGQNAKTILLPGGFAALVDPTDDSLYTATGEFSYPVIYDLGASGMLMSHFVQSSFGVPLTGETWSDVGIGGVETFDVTVPTRLMLMPNRLGEVAADNFVNYAPFGEFSFQAKRSDPSAGPIDLVGTPVLRNYVMQVEPNISPFQSATPFIYHMQTELLPETPALPNQGVYPIALQYKNFNPDVADPPVSVDENPVIPGVVVRDDRKPADQQSAPRDWLLDTGASLTLINETYATEIGIDLLNDPVVATATIEGVGAVQQTLDGYLVDELALPMLGGDELVFTDVTLFVIPDGDNPLPADLPGILGMNLLGPSFNSEAELLLGYIPDSPFEKFYVDSPSNMLYIVDNESTYTSPIPEPAGLFALLILGASLRPSAIRREPRG